MSANTRIHLIEIPVGGSGGRIWNQLHSEREDICEAILKNCRTSPEERSEGSHASVQNDQLQARLAKIDDALDRLMSGSYGNCSKCGRWIEDTKLEVDPALAFCLDCNEEEHSRTTSLVADKGKRAEMTEKIESLAPDVVLEALDEFDTILVRTLNSDYRLLLLDPKTGRALAEGGEYLVEPREVLLSGSTLPGRPFKFGTIANGYGLEMWIDEQVIKTSPIQSVSFEHHAPMESVEAISAAIQ